MSKNVEKMGETAQQMAHSTQRTGKIWSGYLAEVQEINTDFARRATESWIDAFRKQSELNQRMVQRLYGEAEGQSGAVKGMMQDWMGVYRVPFFPFGNANPFADYIRQGMQQATRNAERMTDVTQSTVAAGVATVNDGFPIAGYDGMNTREVSERLSGLSADQLRTVREYERRNKNRDTVIENIDRRIKAANP